MFLNAKVQLLVCSFLALVMVRLLSTMSWKTYKYEIRVQK